MIKFEDWLFEKFPYYFHQNDTNKDGSGKGTFERFLRAFGLELDEEIIPKIENFLDEVDPATCSEDMLNHVSYTLGNPPDITQDVQDYRKLLSIMMSIYKIKGTIRSFELFFAVMGFKVVFIEHDLLPPSQFDISVFDKGFKFDAKCQSCSGYSLVFWPLDYDCSNPSQFVVDQDLLDRIALFIDFNEPIDIHLEELTAGFKLCEEIEATVNEEVTLNKTSFTIFNQSKFDSGFKFDQQTTTQIIIN